jgi:hypothetical protein
VICIQNATNSCIPLPTNDNGTNTGGNGTNTGGNGTNTGGNGTDTQNGIGPFFRH